MLDEKWGLDSLIPYDTFGILNPSLFLEVFVKHFFATAKLYQNAFHVGNGVSLWKNAV